jgi:hypothetical protein
MVKYTEVDLYDEIHEIMVDAFNNDFHMVRIESGFVHRGIPDINIGLFGKEIWIECKVGDFGLSPFQIGFMKQREAVGGKCYILRKWDKTYIVEKVDKDVSRHNNCFDAVNSILHDASGITIRSKGNE